MSDRLARLEARVEEMALVLEALAARIHALEGEGVPGSQAEGASVAAPEPPTVARAADGPVAAEPAAGERWGPVPLLGRTLMVLGGAYFFRALTESGALPSAAGVGLGLAYALAWLAFADRAAGTGRRLSASFHGAAFALIAAPLTWEAVTRFRVISGVGGAVALVALTGGALFVAWRRDLPAAAWFGSLTGLLAAWAVMGSVEPVLPAALALVLIAAASDWVARAREWRVLPWLTAAAADLTLAFMALETLLGESARGSSGPGYGLAGLLLAHFALVVGSAAVAAFRSSWRVRWLDLLQLPAAAVIGYGGAFLLARRLPSLAIGLGVASLIAGLAAMAEMRHLFPRRGDRRTSYSFFAWIGLVLVLGGTALVLPPAARAAVWSVLAVALALVASRRRSVTLGLHAWVYATAAAGASGLLVHAAHAFAASAEGPWAPFRPTAWWALTALAVAASLDLPAESPFWSRVATRTVKLLFLGVLAWSVLGVLCGALAGPVAGAPAAGDGDPAALALLRMAVVAAGALLLAWLGRFRRFRESAWLVYPVLVLGAFKLILEDFLLGRAAELFGALALYGAVLIVAPWLARSDQRASRSEDHPAG